MNSKVAILLTTYNPDMDELCKNLSSYLSQVDYVIFVDNSELTELQLEIKTRFESTTNIILIQLFQNKGIAEAQNIATAKAVELGCDFFIEMDQDSALPNDYVVNVIKTYNRLVGAGKRVAGVGPLAIKKDSDDIYDGLQRTGGAIEKPYTLSSGFLVHSTTVQEVGGKNEDLFIDFVDWDWCWRAALLGYKVYIDTELEIPHMLGDGHKRVFGWDIGMPSPVRHYYQYRNFLYLMLKGYVPLLWKIKYTVILSIKLIVYICLFDKRFERFKYIGTGIVDFVRSKMGKIGDSKSI